MIILFQVIYLFVTNYMIKKSGRIVQGSLQFYVNIIFYPDAINMAHKQQRSSVLTSYFDTKLGRSPMQTITHLSRVLCLPRHNDTTTHLPIYEVGSLYRNAMGSTPIGSSSYTIRLCLMQKPREDGLNARVAYLVDFSRDEKGGMQICLQRREPIGFQYPNVRL